MIPRLFLIVALIHMGQISAADEALAEPLDPLAASLATSDAEVLALLADNGTRRQAWGAWHAGQRGIMAAAPALLDLIHRLRTDRPEADAPQISSEERLLRIIACESLAQLRPHVDGPILDRLLADGDHVLALVLMAEEPERHHQHLRALVDGKTSDLAWAAALNLLASDSKSDVAPQILAATTATMVIIVHDDDGPRMEYWTGFRARTQGSGLRTAPGFPRMRGSLRLSQQARIGSRVIAPGPTTIYLGHGGIIDLDRDAYRIAVLGSLVPDISRVHPLSRQEIIHLRWAGAEALRRDVAAARLALATRWQHVLDALVAAGHLDASAATMPTVRLTLDDQRTNTAEALPDLDAGHDGSR